MHFSGSSKSDCLALVEAFRVSLSCPPEAEVASQAPVSFHTLAMRVESAFFSWLVRASDGHHKVTSAAGTSGWVPANFPKLIKNSKFIDVLTLELNSIT